MYIMQRAWRISQYLHVHQVEGLENQSEIRLDLHIHHAGGYGNQVSPALHMNYAGGMESK